MPWASDGGSSRNAWRCVPVASDPAAPGDACTVEGDSASGIDTCDAHSMCIIVGGNSEGECYPRCVGSENNPYCNQPDHVCAVGASGIVPLCHPSCHPLLGDCGADQLCVPLEGGFVCALDGSGAGTGAAGDPCEFLTACDPGLTCLGAADVGTCATGVARCCTPLCDLEADDCPDPQTCVPWFEPGLAPFGQENVGVCLEAA